MQAATGRQRAQAAGVPGLPQGVPCAGASTLDPVGVTIFNSIALTHPVPCAARERIGPPDELCHPLWVKSLKSNSHTQIVTHNCHTQNIMEEGGLAAAELSLRQRSYTALCKTTQAAAPCSKRYPHVPRPGASSATIVTSTRPDALNFQGWQDPRVCTPYPPGKFTPIHVIPSHAKVMLVAMHGRRKDSQRLSKVRVFINPHTARGKAPQTIPAKSHAPPIALSPIIPSPSPA